MNRLLQRVALEFGVPVAGANGGSDSGRQSHSAAEDLFHAQSGAEDKDVGALAGGEAAAVGTQAGALGGSEGGHADDVGEGRLRTHLQVVRSQHLLSPSLSSIRNGGEGARRAGEEALQSLERGAGTGHHGAYHVVHALGGVCRGGSR